MELKLIRIFPNKLLDTYYTDPNMENSDTNFLDLFKDQRIIPVGENSAKGILINLASISHHLI